MATTYFDLVKDCLVELFYEEPETWADTNTTEGNKVKRLLNHALRMVVLGENIPWKFRQQLFKLVLVEDMKEYPMVDGYITSVRYAHVPLRLYYNDAYVNLDYDHNGMPMYYWIYNDKINVYPRANKTFAGRKLLIEYQTNCCAKNHRGVLKKEMCLEDDEPIIPERYRDILIYSVCRDFRRSLSDSASVFYERKYRELYRIMLSAEKLSNDYPDGLDIVPYVDSLQEVVMNVFQEPHDIGGK